jgi:hypothetical protein
VGTASAQPRDAIDDQLAELSSELVRARFSVTGPAITQLLDRDDLSARQRNQALEIRAVTQLALGDPEAEQTLRLLYVRDPEHRLGNPGLGPAIEAAFARAREGADGDAAGVSLSAARIEADADGGSPLAVVAVTEGAGTIHDVVFSYRDARASAYASLTMPLRGGEARARLPVLGGGELSYYVEARAPSGAALARIGSSNEPLVAELPRPPTRVATFVIDSDDAAERDDGGSVLGEWWLWTAVAVVVGGAIAGWFLLGPPSDDGPSGSLGRGALE